MEIIDTTTKTLVEFGELKEGTVFLYEEHYYLKIAKTDFNVLDLDSYELWDFLNDTLVRAYNSELYLK